MCVWWHRYGEGVERDGVAAALQRPFPSPEPGSGSSRLRGAWVHMYSDYRWQQERRKGGIAIIHGRGWWLVWGKRERVWRAEIRVACMHVHAHRCGCIASWIPSEKQEGEGRGLAHGGGPLLATAGGRDGEASLSPMEKLNVAGGLEDQLQVWDTGVSCRGLGPGWGQGPRVRTGARTVFPGRRLLGAVDGKSYL